MGTKIGIEGEYDLVSIRIQTLQWLGVAVAALCCVLLGGWILLTSLSDFRRFERGADEFRRFHATLNVANAISAERGPANSAMAAKPEEADAKVEALVLQRLQTDAYLSELTALFAEEVKSDPGLAEQMTALHIALRNGRLAVDAVIADREHVADRISAAITRMFAAADAAMAVRDTIGRLAVRGTPQITTEIMLATTASDLREYEGRAGSYVVMILASGSSADVSHARNMGRSIERIKALHGLLATHADAYFDNPTIKHLATEVEQRYFVEGLNYLQSVVAVHGGDNSLNAADFTRTYVPMMASSEQLREAIMLSSQQHLAELRNDAGIGVGVAAGLTAIVLAVLVALTVVLQRSLFGPLTLMREQVTAIAQGDLDEPPAPRRASSEVVQMMASLTRLREHQRHNRALESEQRRLTQQLRTLAETDPLTGLLNRRAFETAAQLTLNDSQGSDAAMAVIILDIDHFKLVNDTYGHAVGDVVLQQVAAKLTTLLRPGDSLARYGGEEFVAIIRDVSAAAAVALAENLRVSLADTIIIADLELRVTGSFGVAFGRANADPNWHAIIAEADRQLYRAKRTGRNRVCCADSVMADEVFEFTERRSD